LNLEEWKAWIDFMESRKISWITWSVSSKKETCSVLLPHAPAEGNWKKEDLNESGIRIREILRSFPSVQN
jgi:endoglucanase